MNIKSILKLLLILLVVLSLTACGAARPAAPAKAENEAAKNDKTEVNNAGIDANTSATKSKEPGEAKSFIITGTGSQDLEISIDDVKNLEAKFVKTDLVKSGGETSQITAKGPTLKDVLKNKGINLDDFAALRLKARDGYSVEIPGNVIKKRDIILAYEFNGQPVSGSDGPVRIVVPGEFAMYWVKSISRIELKKDEAQVAARRILFLDSVGLVPEEYTFDKEGDKALKLKDIFEKFSMEYESSPFLMKARDGLKKTEEMETAKKAYIKVTGENAPEFISPEISYGMYVKNLVWFGTEKEVIFGIRPNLAAYFKSEAVPLERLLQEVNMALKDDKNYLIKASDGYSVEVTGKDIRKGELLLDDKGVRVRFKELQKQYNVKNLMEIAIK